ncbi:MAG: NADH-quinone oxidoreductase subunit L, partial [Bacteroidota bacterium]
LPTTYKTFVVGAIAIAGIFPFAGFFSKDEILWKAFSSDYGSVFLWAAGVLGAALTAFYMFRLVSLTFEGEERYNKQSIHPHEAPKTMTVVLVVLAFLSFVGGFIGIPESLGGGNAIEHWLEPVFADATDKLGTGYHSSSWIEYLLMAISLGIAVAGIYAARVVYLKRREIADSYKERFAGLYKLLWNKYFVDEAYDRAVVVPTVKLSESFLWKWFDVSVIDGAVNGAAKLIDLLAGYVRRIQTGVAQMYAVVFVGGILVVIAWVVFR